MGTMVVSPLGGGASIGMYFRSRELPWSGEDAPCKVGDFLGLNAVSAAGSSDSTASASRTLSFCCRHLSKGLLPLEIVDLTTVVLLSFGRSKRSANRDHDIPIL